MNPGRTEGSIRMEWDTILREHKKGGPTGFCKEYN